MDNFSARARVAAVQASPVFLNRQATVDKACSLIAEAAQHGAKLIAFPEVFIPAYPYWNWIASPIEGYELFKKLMKEAVEVPSETTERLGREAAKWGVYVVMGINERSQISAPTLYNTNLIFAPDGQIIGKHRKIVPTFAEKLTWGWGDGSSLKVYDTPFGRLGTLICGENTNTLARFTLIAQGEQIHVASFPGFPLKTGIVEGIKIHERRALLEGKPYAYSAVYGPNGQVIGNPLVDEEGIVYADIDLEDSIIPRLRHDIAGNYNRFDIFSLSLNTKKHSALEINGKSVYKDQLEPNYILTTSGE